MARTGPVLGDDAHQNREVTLLTCYNEERVLILTNSTQCLPSQTAKFMGPTWGPPGSCRPQMGPMLAPWTLISGFVLRYQTVNTLWKWLVWQVCSPSNIRNRRYLRTTDGRQIRAGTNTRRSRFAAMVAWRPGYNPWIMMLHEAISCVLNVVHKDLKISLPYRLQQGMSRLIILMMYSG